MLFVSELLSSSSCFGACSLVSCLTAARMGMLARAILENIVLSGCELRVCMTCIGVLAHARAFWHNVPAAAMENIMPIPYELKAMILKDVWSSFGKERSSGLDADDERESSDDCAAGSKRKQQLDTKEKAAQEGHWREAWVVVG